MRALVPVSAVFFVAAALAGAPEPAAAQPEAALIGLAVADSAGHDARGDIDLTGIRHVSHADSFPFTTSLTVYTRWSGDGTHDIGISVWSLDTAETVAETEQSVDFSAVGVTSFVCTIPRATFPRRGAYDVEVAVDGDLAADYSLFLNATGSPHDEPQLVLSVPARRGVLGGGAASVLGIPDDFSFDRFPAAGSFAFVTLWFSGSAGHEQSMEILDPTGVPIAKSPPRPIPTDAGGMSLMTDSFPGVSLAVRGTYTAVLYLDGEDILEYPLPVTRNQR